MGDGTSTSFVIGRPPRGVEAREGENWPRIPKNLLKLTAEELIVEELLARQQAELEAESPFPNLETIEKLERSAVIFQFAALAVRRLEATPSSS